MEIVISSIKILVYSFVGGYFLGEAVKRYKDEEYFVFGVNVMLVIYEILLMAYTTFVA